MITDFITFSSIYLMIGEIIIYLFCKKNKLTSQLLPILNAALFFRIFLTFLYYYMYFIKDPGDCSGYYHYAINHNFNLKDFLTPGSCFINNLTIIISKIFIYFDNPRLMSFIPYSVAGFIGSLLFYNCLSYIGLQKGKLLYFLAFFLPNIVFWSSNIGKDSLMYLGIILFIYSHFFHASLLKRTIFLSFSITLMYLIRPHVVLILIFSYFLGLLMQKLRFSFRTIFFYMVIIISFLITYDNLLRLVGIKENIDKTDIYEIYTTGKSSIEKHSSHIDKYGAAMGASNTIEIIKSPYYLIRFLFSPFLWHARNAIQLISAIETMIYQFIFLYILINIRVLFKTKLFINKTINFKYMWINFILIISTIFGMGFTNFGLTVRQRCMVLPFIILFFAAIIIEKKNLKALLSSKIHKKRYYLSQTTPGTHPSYHLN